MVSVPEDCLWHSRRPTRFEIVVRTRRCFVRFDCGRVEYLWDDAGVRNQRDCLVVIVVGVVEEVWRLTAKEQVQSR